MDSKYSNSPNLRQGKRRTSFVSEKNSYEYENSVLGFVPEIR